MNDINWTKWSSIAEIVSSVAILVTLLYLAVQTKQNTDAIESQLNQSLVESAQFEQSIWIQYPELSVLIMDNSIEMTLEQKVQLDSLMLLSFSRREFSFRQYKAGILSEDVWRKETEIISLLLGTERTREWWALIGKSGFDQAFIDAIDETIRGQPLHEYWKGLEDW